MAMNGLGHGLQVAVRTGVAPLIMGLRWATHEFDDHGGRTIPAFARSWRVLSKRALDEFFLATELASATIVSVREHGRVNREMHEAVALFDERGWLDEPGSYHRSPPPLENPTREFSKGYAARFEHLRFESGYEPHDGEPGRERWLGYESNHTAHAWLMEHPGGPRPWVVCIPGYRMGHPAVDFAGFRARWLYRQLGLNVAIPVLPMHGPRRHGRRGGDGFLSGDFLDTVHAQSQAVWDVRRLIGWLREDRGALGIGAYGVSLGGYTTALVAGLEDDLDCAIAGSPAADFLRLLRCHMPPVATRAATAVGFPFDIIEQVLRVISPLSIPPRLAAHRRYLYAGKADSLVTPDHAHDLWRHWGQPKISWYEGGHVSFLWEKQVMALVHEALHATGLVHHPPELPAET